MATSREATPSGCISTPSVTFNEAAKRQVTGGPIIVKPDTSPSKTLSNSLSKTPSTTTSNTVSNTISKTPSNTQSNTASNTASNTPSNTPSSNAASNRPASQEPNPAAIAVPIVLVALLSVFLIFWMLRRRRQQRPFWPSGTFNLLKRNNRSRTEPQSVGIDGAEKGHPGVHVQPQELATKNTTRKVPSWWPKKDDESRQELPAVDPAAQELAAGATELDGKSRPSAPKQTSAGGLDASENARLREEQQKKARELALSGTQREYSQYEANLMANMVTQEEIDGELKSLRIEQGRRQAEREQAEHREAEILRLIRLKERTGRAGDEGSKADPQLAQSSGNTAEGLGGSSKLEF